MKRVETMKNTSESLTRKFERVIDPEIAADLFARAEANEARRREAMPDEQTAIGQMWSAYQRLTEIGWQDAIYCPKDGTVFEALTAGSCGVFDCFYRGEWPKGSCWVWEAGDLWSVRPILWRPKRGNSE